MTDTTAESTETTTGDGAKASPAEYDLLNPWEPTMDELAPAYHAAAAVLNDGQWHKWWEVHDHMADACPDATEEQLRNFFRKSERQGWFTRKHIPANQQARVDSYRVSAAGLIARPELRGREGQFSKPPAWTQAVAQVDWLNDPRLDRPESVPEQPRPEPPAPRKTAAPAAAPRVATIVAQEGDLHPSKTCRCGLPLVFRNGKNPPAGNRWACSLNKSRPGYDDASHDRVWAD